MRSFTQAQNNIFDSTMEAKADQEDINQFFRTFAINNPAYRVTNITSQVLLSKGDNIITYDCHKGTLQGTHTRVIPSNKTKQTALTNTIKEHLK